MAKHDTNNIVKEIRWEGKIAIIDAFGDIDLHRSNNFQKALQDVLKEKPSKMVINLTDVNYMDSSGVATLVKLLSNTRKAKIDLAIAGANKRVQSVFEITRLNSVFNIFDTVQQAID